MYHFQQADLIFPTFPLIWLVSRNVKNLVETIAVSWIKMAEMLSTSMRELTGRMLVIV